VLTKPKLPSRLGQEGGRASSVERMAWWQWPSPAQRRSFKSGSAPGLWQASTLVGYERRLRAKALQTRGAPVDAL